MFQVEIVNSENECVDNENLEINVSEDEYLLDALESAGHTPPYSCREGMCTSCVAKIIEGEFKREGSGLDNNQQEDYVLTCASTPLTDCCIEVDAQQDLFSL